MDQEHGPEKEPADDGTMIKLLHSDAELHLTVMYCTCQSSHARTCQSAPQLGQSSPSDQQYHLTAHYQRVVARKPVKTPWLWHRMYATRVPVELTQGVGQSDTGSLVWGSLRVVRARQGTLWVDHYGFDALPPICSHL